MNSREYLVFVTAGMIIADQRETQRTLEELERIAIRDDAVVAARKAHGAFIDALAEVIRQATPEAGV